MASFWNVLWKGERMTKNQIKKIIELMEEMVSTVKEIHKLQKVAMKVFEECRVNHLIDEEE